MTEFSHDLKVMHHNLESLTRVPTFKGKQVGVCVPVSLGLAVPHSRKFPDLAIFPLSFHVCQRGCCSGTEEQVQLNTRISTRCTRVAQPNCVVSTAVSPCVVTSLA